MMDKVGIPNKRYHIGICYVILPGNVDRGTYVQNCFRKGMITVQFENGSYMDNIPIEIEVLQYINFPLNKGELGSALIYNNIYLHNKPIIVGRLLKGNETTNLSENEFRFERFTENSLVSISGKGSDGNLFIKVSGKTNKTGNIFIDVVNDNNEGNIKVNLQGNLQVELQSAILNVLNELGITSKKDINIDSETKINIGNKDKVQATFKGDDTVIELKKEVKALSDLLQSIANIVPSPVSTGAPDATWAAWQLAVSAITTRGDYSKVQSEKLFIE